MTAVAGGGAAPLLALIAERPAPVVAVSRDRAVMRYVADTVISVPPGAGPVVSLLVPAGRRLLRRRAAWRLAAALGSGRVVILGGRRR